MIGRNVFDDTDSLFELLTTPDYLAPCQYADSLSSPLSRLSPEQRLVIMLLRDCVSEYQSGGRRDKMSALRWLAEHEHPINADYFSFPYCCEVLGYEPDLVRAGVVRACTETNLRQFAIRMQRRQLVQAKRERAA
jgi:hypothetical protein